MELAYTITKGVIKHSNKECEIPFALVFLDDGVYIIETYINDKSFVNFDHYEDLSLIGKTEKDFDIQILGLRYTKYKNRNDKATFICYDFIKLSDNRKTLYSRPKEQPKRGERIWYIEIEGLQTKFGDKTISQKYRDSGKVDELVNFEFDHTSCALIIEHSEFRESYFNLIFCNNPLSDNIIIDLTASHGYNELFFKDYMLFKNDLVSFISFMNGGEVFVRRELVGGYYMPKAFDSQTVYYHSRTKLSNFSCNEYLPIKNHSYTNNSFGELFLKCFNVYHHLNKQFDFNSLVSSLNNAELTPGLDEKYFILITALEKITSKYSKVSGKEKSTVMNDEVFNKLIKPRLIEVLNQHKKEINECNNTTLGILVSKISGINYMQNNRLLSFFEYAKIPINENVKRLIKVERNLAVHEGIIGSTETEKIINYLKLDHILRDCILNLIGYTKERNRKLNY